MFPDCCNSKINPDLKRVRLKYVPRITGVVKSDDKSKSDDLVAQTRLMGTCAIPGNSTRTYKFVVDTGSPFTIISNFTWQPHKKTNHPLKVKWGDNSERESHELQVAGKTLKGQFHWVDILLAEFEHNPLKEPALNFHVLAFCVTDDEAPEMPDVILGLGCRGIESRGLCINLAKGEDLSDQHDAWLIDVNNESANVV